MVFLTSCEYVEYDETSKKELTIGYNTYPIVKANDSCEYYIMKISSTSGSKNYYFHYPQCMWCKNHK